ncbi:MAG: BolA family protein [Gammaproteobacteria bacterium]|nr:BolA family protein [Gammaproteobacteria bacterium]
MRRRLTIGLQPTRLEIEDQSHLHAGHTGAKEGKGHFKVTIVSPSFAGLSPIKQHRLVYEALGEMMQTDIHAVTILASSS